MPDVLKSEKRLAMNDPAAQTGYRTLPFPETRDFVRSVFVAHGYSPDDAADIADVVLRTDLYGIAGDLGLSPPTFLLSSPT